MIELVMPESGMVAHIRDRHVTWCGLYAPGDRAVPSSPRVCPNCIKQIIADGGATDKEMSEALKPRRSTR